MLFAVNGDTASLRVFATGLALLPCTKREGAILWFIAAACGAVVIWQRKRSWRPLLWLLPGPVFFVAWKIFLHAMNANVAREFAPISLAVLEANSTRIATIGRMVVAELLDVAHWSVFWPAVVGAFAYLAWRVRDRRLLLLLFVALAAPLMIYAAMFVFSTEPDWVVHLGGSVRLLLHVMPLGWLAIAWAMTWHIAKPSNSDE
jgi:hypothetical protein